MKNNGDSILSVTLRSLNTVRTKITPYTICLGIILFAGFILRVYGNNFGLPMLLHPDEPTLLNPAILISQKGDLNPHFFKYPSLFIYICAAIFKLEYLLEGTGLIRVDRSMLYLTGRYLSAVMGTLTLLIVYYIGKNLYSKNTGIVAAAFLMAMPLAVKNSHFVAVDIPVTFFITLSFLFASLILKTGAKKYYIFAGIAAGLAASTKYNGGLILLPIFIAHLFFIQNNTADLNIVNKFKNIFLSKKLFFSISLSGLAYIITAPYTLLDFKTFWRDFTIQISGVTTSQGVTFIGTAPGWIYHFEKSLKQGMTYNLEILSALGVIYILLLAIGYVVLRKRFESKLTNIQCGVLLLSWVLPYYLIVGSWETKFARYVIPLLPFLAVLGANLLVDAVEYSMQIVAKSVNFNLLKTIAISLIVLGLVGTSVQASIKVGDELLKEDSRLTALRWIDENIPKGSIIIREQSAPECELVENVRCINYGYWLASHDHDEFIEIGANYIIVSSGMYGMYRSHPDESAKQIRFYDSLDERYELVKVFKRSEDNRGPEEIKIYRIDYTVLLDKPGGFRDDFTDLVYWGTDLSERTVLGTDGDVATYQPRGDDQPIDVDFSAGLDTGVYPYFEARMRVDSGKLSIAVYDSTGGAHPFLNNYTTNGDWEIYKFNLHDWLVRNGHDTNVHGIRITGDDSSTSSAFDWMSIHNHVFWDAFEDGGKVATTENVTVIQKGATLSKTNVNLALNPSFEEGKEKPDNWLAAGSPFYSEEECGSGKKCIKVDLKNYYYQQVKYPFIKNDTNYTYSLYAKQSAPGDALARVQITFYKTTGEYEYAITNLKVSSSYSRYQNKFTIPKTTEFIYIGARGAREGGWIYIDDVSLTEETYELSGRLISTVTQTENPIISVTPAWNSIGPDGTAIAVEISVDNGTTWTKAENGVPINYTLNDSNRHLLYRAFFRTGDVHQSPVLHDVTLIYEEKLRPF